MAIVFEANLLDRLLVTTSSSPRLRKCHRQLSETNQNRSETSSSKEINNHGRIKGTHQVVVMEELKRSFRLSPEMITSFRNVQIDGR